VTESFYHVDRNMELEVGSIRIRFRLPQR